MWDGNKEVLKDKRENRKIEEQRKKEGGEKQGKNRNTSRRKRKKGIVEKKIRIFGKD